MKGALPSVLVSWLWRQTSPFSVYFGGRGGSARHNFSWCIRDVQIIAGEIKLTGHSLVVQLGSLHPSKYIVLKTALVLIVFIFKVSAADTSRVIDRGILQLHPLQPLLQPVLVIQGKTMIVDTAIFVVIIGATSCRTVMATPGMTGAPCSQSGVIISILVFCHSKTYITLCKWRELMLRSSKF